MALLTFSTFDYSLIESSSCSLPAILLALPRKTLETMTGNMLGDGSIGYPNLGRDGEPKGNARYGMTMSAKVKAYLQSLFDTIYAQYSNSGLHPYPNVNLPQHANKAVTQYMFNSRSLPIFTALHKL